MLTKREKTLNVFWLVVLALPSVANIYSCISASKGMLSIALGFTSSLILFGSLIFFIQQHSTEKPLLFMNRSFFPLLLSYVPSIIGYWNHGLTLTTLLIPLIAYAFFPANERIQKWANSGANETPKC